MCLAREVAIHICLQCSVLRSSPAPTVASMAPPSSSATSLPFNQLIGGAVSNPLYLNCSVLSKVKRPRPRPRLDTTILVLTLLYRQVSPVLLNTNTTTQQPLNFASSNPQQGQVSPCNMFWD